VVWRWAFLLSASASLFSEPDKAAFQLVNSGLIVSEGANFLEEGDGLGLRNSALL
jgi:hypothetical protein